MKTPTIECPECKGTGSTKLPELLTATLSALGKKAYTAHELNDWFPTVTPNAINNRLESLRRLGFVQRERRGKFWLYSRVTAAKSDPLPARHS